MRNVARRNAASVRKLKSTVVSKKRKTRAVVSAIAESAEAAHTVLHTHTEMLRLISSAA